MLFSPFPRRILFSPLPRRIAVGRYKEHVLMGLGIIAAILVTLAVKVKESFPLRLLTGMIIGFWLFFLEA
jgi:hypothetical protein